MITVKFVSIKLIISGLYLFFAINLLIPINCEGAQKNADQVVASKTPVSIKDFSLQHKFTEPVTEFTSDTWFCYSTWNYNDLKSASTSANELILKTGIKHVYPRNDVQLNAYEGLSDSKNTTGHNQKSVNARVNPDSSSNAAENKTGSSYDYIGNTLENVYTYVEKNKINSNIFPINFSGITVHNLQKELISYANNNFPIFLRRVFISLIEKTYTYPIILLFIILIIVFIVNIVFVLIVIYYSNQQKNQKERYIRIFNTMYEGVFRSYLFGEINWEKVLIKLKKVNNPLNRKILTNVLLNFQENLRGEMDNTIPEIFVNLGLHNDALKLANSWHYNKQVEGFRQITNLYPKGAERIIHEYINHSNDLIRAEAQTSYLRVHQEKPFDFLRKLTRPFTHWTQLSTFHLFRLHQLPVPSFVDYLDSEQPTVRNFCLKMIIYFQQLENASEVFKMLDSEMELTRFLSIRAINDLRLYQGKDLIKLMYPNETKKNQIEIIKAFKNIGNSKDFDFLENIIESGSVTAKTEACRSLFYMSREGYEKLISINLNDNFKIENYIAHVYDPRN